ncbi:MAG: 4Fe-4S binding protein [Clostridia bacterium]|nr:4Fe-4S binding protein [Clostridia bacterium]
MEGRSHSVTLEVEKCKGCTTCIRYCPTEAIRVRGGRARINSDLCIDCGQCIRVCPNHAKQAVFDQLQDSMGRFKYKVALPAPTLYGQFNNLDDIDFVLAGLLEMGFDAVFEVARAAEIVSDYSRKLMETRALTYPVISSACPAVVRLIRSRFPSLCTHVMSIKSPMHVAAALARTEAMEKTGLARDEIGIFFISPCPAKVTDAREPIGSMSSEVDCVVSVANIYKPLLLRMNKLKDGDPRHLASSGIMGISWATSGGEASALLEEKYLAADGIENVIKVLEELEDDKLSDISFIELNACPGGCVGGASTLENPFVAKARIQMLRRFLPVSRNKYEEREVPPHIVDWHFPLDEQPTEALAEDISEAMRKMQEIERLTAELPGLDCGACGAPSCEALARDVVAGRAKENACLFVLKHKLGELFEDAATDALTDAEEDKK